MYYWFQQRDCVVESEYLVMWYWLIDHIRKWRSDGALVRFATIIGPTESMAKSDRRRVDFAANAVPALGDFMPNWEL